MLPRSARGDEEAADCGGGSASEFRHAGDLQDLGLATASMAVALVAGAPPPPLPLGLDRNTYFLAVVYGLFLSGVAAIYAAVWVSDDPSGGRCRAVGRKLVYASVVPFAVAVVISMATLLW